MTIVLLRWFPVLVLVAGLGCRPSAPVATTGGETNAYSVGGEEAQAAVETQIAATLSELTQAVRKYSVEQRRAPKTLEELVSAGYLSQVPAGPPGKKFAISRQLEVYLADE